MGYEGLQAKMLGNGVLLGVEGGLGVVLHDLRVEVVLTLGVVRGLGNFGENGSQGLTWVRRVVSGKGFWQTCEGTSDQEVKGLSFKSIGEGFRP